MAHVSRQRGKAMQRKIVTARIPRAFIGLCAMVGAFAMGAAPDAQAQSAPSTAGTKSSDTHAHGPLAEVLINRTPPTHRTVTHSPAPGAIITPAHLPAH